jgi:hypothetical protein
MADQKNQAFGKADRAEEIDEDQLQQAVGGTRTTAKTSFPSVMKTGVGSTDDVAGKTG